MNGSGGQRAADVAAAWLAGDEAPDAAPKLATDDALAPGAAPGPAAAPDATPAPVPAPATIARLADDLLPALIARLDASGLGELEVRTESWRIRLRKPFDRRRPVPVVEGRRRRTEAADSSRPGRAGEPLGAPSGERSAVEPGGAAERVVPADPLSPAVAASPAVGYFSPREGWSAGRHVRHGDIVGFVDCLGVRQEVLAPVDGFIGRFLAQPGEAVEYGQPLIQIDLPAPVSASPTPEPPSSEFRSESAVAGSSSSASAPEDA